MPSACQWLMISDDHEVQNVYAGVQAGRSGLLDPATPAYFLARRDSAYRACYEHLPIPASVLTQGLAGLATGVETCMYTRLPYGRLTSLIRSMPASTRIRWLGILIFDEESIMKLDRRVE